MTRLVLTIGCMALLLGGAGSAQASMELTLAAQADGFQLSTFASGFPNFPAGNGNGGPFGIAFAGNGTVLATDLNGDIYVFPSDANNQTVSGATVGATYNSFDPLGMTQTGGKIYVGFQSTNLIKQVSSTGTFVSNLASIPQPHGIVVNPTNGDLLVSSDSGSLSGAGIWEVNPVSGAVTNIYSGRSFDGLTTDGVIVYAAREDGEVVGIRISDGAQVFDAGNIAGADGIALGTGTLAGNLYVNTNFGSLIQVNVATKVQTTIGTGGSRGDFVTVDPNNGSLLLDQSDSILRLSAPEGGGFGPTTTPEPSSLMLFAVGAAGLAIYGWRRKALKAVSL
jgi:hypothetical protein